MVDPSFVYSRDAMTTPSQEVLPALEPPHSAPLPSPPPPLGCCPRYGFFDEPASFLRSFASVISIEAPAAFKAVSKEPTTFKEFQLTSKAKGKQKAISHYGKAASSLMNSRVYFQYRSTEVRINERRRGFLRPGDDSEHSTKWPLDALLPSDLSLSSLDENSLIDPARYEALINRQLLGDNCGSSGRVSQSLNSEVRVFWL